LSRRTDILLVAVLAVTVLQRVDHVLRFDHSGWPFRAKVVPFRFSLLVNRVILFGLFEPAASLLA
jgi:hypothetical protein